MVGFDLRIGMSGVLKVGDVETPGSFYELKAGGSY